MSSSIMATPPSPQSARILVSIVIPNYNYGRYLRIAIDSALAHTYSPVEVIVVDDGSTDDSREVIESYRDRIAPIIKGNGGHGSALNAGYAKSRGEIVIFLDADDELMPDAVDQVLKAWRPGVAKAQFQLEMVDENGKPLGERVPAFDDFFPNGDIRDRITRFGEYPSSPSSGNAYARSALERLMPMDETLWVAGSEKSLVYLTPFFGDVAASPAHCGIFHSRDHLQCRSRQRDRARSARAGLDLEGIETQDGFDPPRSEDSSDRKRHAPWIGRAGNKSVDARTGSESQNSRDPQRMVRTDGDRPDDGRITFDSACTLAGRLSTPAPLIHFPSSLRLWALPGRRCGRGTGSAAGLRWAARRLRGIR